jgi:hypothetical protein
VRVRAYLDSALVVADEFAETLTPAGVKRIYGIVGDSLNGITDAIRRQGKIDWIHVRHEEVTAFAASADAQLTGSLAVCAGSCGPGNLHLINGLFDCHRSRVPVLGIAATFHRPKSARVMRCRTNAYYHYPSGDELCNWRAPRRCSQAGPAGTSFISRLRRLGISKERLLGNTVNTAGYRQEKQAADSATFLEVIRLLCFTRPAVGCGPVCHLLFFWTIRDAFRPDDEALGSWPHEIEGIAGD